MKKNFKRTLAKVMAVALTVSMVGVASTDADAAKKIKLSSKSISVAKGATKKVTIKNVKAKKVEVTVNPIDINNVIGHKKENVIKLNELYNVDLIVKQDKNIKQGKSKIEVIQTYEN